GRGLRELFGEDDSEARDGGRGCREACGVVEVFVGGLVQEREAGGARSDVGKCMRAVRRVEEVALEHHVSDRAGECDAVWLKCAEDGFEIVDLLRERGVGKGFAETWGVEGDRDGVGGGDGEAEAAGGIYLRG